MTPDEIATRVVSGFTGDEYWIDRAAAIERVAAALRAYAAQERERCAGTLDRLPGSHEVARCAQAIRALD